MVYKNRLLVIRVDTKVTISSPLSLLIFRLTIRAARLGIFVSNAHSLKDRARRDTLDDTLVEGPNSSVVPACGVIRCQLVDNRGEPQDRTEH